MWVKRREPLIVSAELRKQPPDRRVHRREAAIIDPGRRTRHPPHASATACRMLAASGGKIHIATNAVAAATGIAAAALVQPPEGGRRPQLHWLVRLPEREIGEEWRAAPPTAAQPAAKGGDELRRWSIRLVGVIKPKVRRRKAVSGAAPAEVPLACECVWACGTCVGAGGAGRA